MAGRIIRSVFSMTCILCCCWVPLFAGWSKVNGPEGGQISFVKSTPWSIYAVSSTDGLYRSDGVQPWSACNNGLIPNYGLYSLLYRDTSTLFIGSDGVYKSVDKGLNWQISSTGIPPYTVIRSLGNYGRFVFAASDCIYKSSDSGASWSQASGKIANYSICSLVGAGSSLFAGTDKGVFRSSDSGTTWDSVGLSNKYIQKILPYKGHLFAGIWTNDTGIYRSDDNGATWIARSAGASPCGILDLAVLNDTLYAADAGYGHVFTSVDTGEHWAGKSNGLPRPSVRTLDAFGGFMYTGAPAGGVYRKRNGDTAWTPFTAGMPAGIGQLIVSDSAWVLGNELGIYCSKNQGSTWDLNLTLQNGVSALTCFTTTFLAAGYNPNGPGVFLSNDFGKTWPAAAANLPNSVSSIIVSGTILYAAYWQSVYMSDNGGPWKKTFTCTDSGYSGITSPLAGDNGNLYFTVDNTRFLHSPDSGLHWDTLAYPTPHSQVIGLDVKNDTIVAWGAASGSLALSVDAGKTWNNISMNINSRNIFSFARQGSVMFAGTDNGLFVAVGSGSDWNVANSDFHSRVGFLTVRNGWIYACGGGTIWSCPVSDFLNTAISPYKTPAPQQQLGNARRPDFVFDIRGRRLPNKKEMHGLFIYYDRKLQKSFLRVNVGKHGD
jgi:hypothetical protein